MHFHQTRCQCGLWVGPYFDDRNAQSYKKSTSRLRRFSHKTVSREVTHDIISLLRHKTVVKEFCSNVNTVEWFVHSKQQAKVW